LICLKHYALNSQEKNRFKVDVRPSDRTLHELCLPAFEAGVREGGTLTVTGAYNRYFGDNRYQSRVLVQDILKGAWGFDGVLVSDWSRGGS